MSPDAKAGIPGGGPPLEITAPILFLAKRRVMVDESASLSYFIAALTLRNAYGRCTFLFDHLLVSHVLSGTVTPDRMVIVIIIRTFIAY